MSSAADQILQPLKALQEDNPDISVDTMKEAMQSILKDLQGRKLAFVFGNFSRIKNSIYKFAFPVNN